MNTNTTNTQDLALEIAMLRGSKTATVSARIVTQWFALDSMESIQHGVETECLYIDGCKRPTYKRDRAISGIPGDQPSVDDPSCVTVGPWGPWSKSARWTGDDGVSLYGSVQVRSIGGKTLTGLFIGQGEVINGYASTNAQVVGTDEVCSVYFLGLPDRVGCSHGEPHLYS